VFAGAAPGIRGCVHELQLYGMKAAFDEMISLMLPALSAAL
jgi:hypothetical protein